MKKLVLVAASLILSASFLHAKDKDFSASIETKNILKKGVNNINILLRGKSGKITDGNIKFKLFKDGENISKYTADNVNNSGKYSFDINFPTKGEYKYLLSFNIKGGVIHNRRGTLEVR